MRQFPLAASTLLAFCLSANPTLLPGLGPADFTSIPPVDLPLSVAQPVAIAGDWNNDGLSDLMIYSGSATAFPVDFHFFTSTAEMAYTLTDTQSLTYLLGPAAADLNNVPGEEVPGLPFAAGGVIGVAALLGNGNGTFGQTVASSTVSTGTRTPVVYTADFERDGDNDILASADGTVFTSFLNDGAGNFTPDNFPYTGVGAVLVSQSAPGALPRIVNVFQQTIFDNVGNPIGVSNEVITAVYSGSAWTFETLLVNTTTQGEIDSFPVIAADLNGDGRQDIIAVEQGTVVGFLASPANGAFNPGAKILVTGLSGSVLNAGDIDGDGDDDLIQYVGETASVAENLGNGAFSTFTLNSGGPFFITGVGNFAGSALTDLFRVTANGSNTRLTVLRQGAGAPPLPSTLVLVQALTAIVPGNGQTLDLNGDGRFDVADVIARRSL